MTNRDDTISSLAQQIRRNTVQQLGSIAGQCDRIAVQLRDALRDRGIAANSVAGAFRTDRPLDPDRSSYYGDEYRARHVWLEVSSEIVDATADQFNEFLSEAMPDLVIGTYDQLSRYEKQSEWPVPDTSGEGG